MNKLTWININHSQPQIGEQCIFKVLDGDYDIYESGKFIIADLERYKYWLPVSEIVKNINNPEECKCIKCINPEDILDAYALGKKSLESSEPISYAILLSIAKVHFNKSERFIEIVLELPLTRTNGFLFEALESSQTAWLPKLAAYFLPHFKEVKIKYSLDNSINIKDSNFKEKKQVAEIVEEVLDSVEPEESLNKSKWQVANQLLKEFEGQLTSQNKWRYRFGTFDYGVDDIDMYNAVNKARELLHDGVKGGLAAHEAAKKHKVDSAEVGKHLGIISGLVKRKRKDSKS